MFGLDLVLGTRSFNWAVFLLWADTLVILTGFDASVTLNWTEIWFQSPTFFYNSYFWDWLSLLAIKLLDVIFNSLKTAFFIFHQLVILLFNPFWANHCDFSGIFLACWKIWLLILLPVIDWLLNRVLFWIISTYCGAWWLMMFSDELRST